MDGYFYQVHSNELNFHIGLGIYSWTLWSFWIVATSIGNGVAGVKRHARQYQKL